jgi:hypothetical protein
MKARFAIPLLLLSVCFFTGCPSTDTYVIKLHTDASPGNVTFSITVPPTGSAVYYLNVIQTASDGTFMSILYQNYFIDGTPPVVPPITVAPSTYIQIFGSYSAPATGEPPPGGGMTYNFFTPSPTPPRAPYNYTLNKADGSPGVMINTMGLMP